MADLLKLAKSITTGAKAGEQIEAYVTWERETDIRVYEGDVESFSSAESAGVGVRVIANGRQGFAYVGDLDEGHAREALEEARDNASFAGEDENLALAVPDGVVSAELELWSDAMADFDSAKKIALAVELERMVRASDARVRQVVSADYGDALFEAAVASTNGIEATSRQTTCYIAVDAVAGEGDDTQTGSGVSAGRDPSALDLEFVASEAVGRAVRMLGAKKAPSAELTVVLDRRVTATLLSILASTLSGEEVAKKRSLFVDRLGEDVALASITLIEDPTNGLAFGAAANDAEGLACRRVPLIDGGKLSGYLYDTYSAGLAGAKSTGSAVRAGFKSTPGVGARALSLLPGDLDKDAILRLVGDGLYVQSVTGVHSGVNPISGDFSVGAEGLMIRAGELAEPVREVTIASTIQRMLQHVIAVGNDIEWLPSVASGLTLAIGGIAMSGT